MELRNSQPMQHYSGIKRKELLIHITTWMDLRGILLSDKKSILKCYILCGSI